MTDEMRLKMRRAVVAESGRGQPHSKTLARSLARHSVREVLECGCPLPLYIYRRF